jgi:hypothetical protein
MIAGFLADESAVMRVESRQVTGFKPLWRLLKQFSTCRESSTADPHRSGAKPYNDNLDVLWDVVNETR